MKVVRNRGGNNEFAKLYKGVTIYGGSSNVEGLTQQVGAKNGAKV